MALNRTHNTALVTIASGADESDAFDMSDASGIEIHMPAAWTAASIGFLVSPTAGGTYLPLYDSDDALVSITPAASQAHTAPTSLFTSRFVKLWSQTAGSGVNQGAERSLTVVMKS